MRRLRVIIADDNAEFRRTLSEYLQTMDGIDIVAEAIDGKHVVELALKIKPDVVIMDISMPLLTGIESTRLIKNHYPEITVVILTLHDAAVYRQLAKEALADGFISKNAMKTGLERFIASQQFGKTYEV
ncbi:response regulator transcription factor [bacterium]|nr:response regulator transcription factor [bacterium]